MLKSLNLLFVQSFRGLFIYVNILSNLAKLCLDYSSIFAAVWRVGGREVGSLSFIYLDLPFLVIFWFFIHLCESYTLRENDVILVEELVLIRHVIVIGMLWELAVVVEHGAGRPVDRWLESELFQHFCLKPFELLVHPFLVSNCFKRSLLELRFRLCDLGLKRTLF